MADNFNISDVPESAGPKSVEVPGDIADGTAGELLTWDAAGVAALVATGAATEVLTSNGAGAAPTFQAGGGAPVASVFTRVGAVVAAASDYDASQVDNDSGVAGAFVDDALDNLAGAILALPTDFLGLTDTPATYVGQAGKQVAVNNGETALEFVNPTLARFTANDGIFPITASAGVADRNAHGLITFEDTVDKEIRYEDIIPATYNANRGVQVVLQWAAATAIVGDVNWVVAFENLAAGGQDLDSDGFAGGVIVADTTDGTNGVLTYTVLTFTNAQADAIAPGNSFRLRVSRNASGGADTMVGDAQLLGVHVRQN